MAFKTDSTNNRQSKADAFINVTFTDTEGNEYRLRKGIPLELTDRVERSIINKCKADANFTLNLVGRIHVIPDVSEDMPDIAL
jgi:hypothetical protein